MNSTAISHFAATGVAGAQKSVGGTLRDKTGFHGAEFSMQAVN
ncbi:hypothetical protein [Candidatus Halocynthiibacter alkanivorans]|nr:hypothetical protein [Candidatus Halocynthiibacter alkanivorans]